MMLAPEYTYRTPAQLARFDEFVAALRNLVQAVGDFNPYVFHGTGSQCASWISREGFEPTYLGSAPVDHPEHAVYRTRYREGGVHWGNLDTAIQFAKRYGSADELPVILMARLSDVIKSGDPVVDWVYFADDESFTAEMTWRDSIRLGAMAVLGGRHVPNLQVINPMAMLPVHPGWSEARQRRLASHATGSPRVMLQHPEVYEDTDLNNPPDMPEGELDAVMVRWHDEWFGNRAIAP